MQFTTTTTTLLLLLLALTIKERAKNCFSSFNCKFSFVLSLCWWISSQMMEIFHERILVEWEKQWIWIAKTARMCFYQILDFSLTAAVEEEFSSILFVDRSCDVTYNLIKWVSSRKKLFNVRRVTNTCTTIKCNCTNPAIQNNIIPTTNDTQWSIF